MTLHGKGIPLSLEAPEPAQARGQGVQASQSRAEVGREGTRPPRRSPLSQPRGQHAHGSEKDIEVQIVEGQSLEDEEIGEEEISEKGPEAYCEESGKGLAQTPRNGPGKGSARWPDRRGPQGLARKQGARLRPGVTKKESDMTLQEMRRKGSWAVRFYGRAKLPPLVDAKGQPTRHALSAHAWGEPVPKTVAAARRIAAKGERLLARYRRAKAK